MKILPIYIKSLNYLFKNKNQHNGSYIGHIIEVVGIMFSTSFTVGIYFSIHYSQFTKFGENFYSSLLY